MPAVASLVLLPQAHPPDSQLWPGLPTVPPPASCVQGREMTAEKGGRGKVGGRRGERWLALDVPVEGLICLVEERKQKQKREVPFPK